MSQLARACEHGGQQVEAQNLCVHAIIEYGIERAIKSKVPGVVNMVQRLRNIGRIRGQIETEDDLLSYLHTKFTES